MKTAILLSGLLIASSGWARTFTPMQIVEKSSYALTSLVKKNAVDASYATDVMSLSLEVLAQETIVEMKSPSDDATQPNVLRLHFNSSGSFKSAENQFKGKYSKGPVFAKANAATLIDLGAEAIVDHLSESPDLVIVSNTATRMTMAPQATGAHLAVTLADGRVYHIQMDADGNVLSKGF